MVVPDHDSEESGKGRKRAGYGGASVKGIVMGKNTEGFVDEMRID
jgi:hypothetical protein